MMVNRFTRIIIFVSGLFLGIVKDYGQTANSIDSLNTVVDTTGNYQIKSQALIKLSEILSEMDFLSSKKLAVEAVRTSENTNNTILYARALSHLGTIFWINGQYDSSLLVNNSALKMRLAEGDSSGMAENYHNIGLILYYKSEYNQALKFYNKSLSIWKSKGDSLHIMKLYSHIGLIYEKCGKYPEAYEYLLKSSRMKIQTNGYNLGLYNISGASDEHTRLYYQNEIVIQKKNLEEEMVKKNLDQINLAKAHHNLGLNYYYLEKYDSALFHLKASSSIKSRLGILPWWNDLANTYSKLGLIDSAIFCHKIGLEMYKKRGNRINVVATYEALASTYMKSGRIDEAIDSYTAALEINMKMGNKQSIANNYRDLGSIYFLQGKEDLALKYVKKSLEVADEIGALKSSRGALKLLVDIYSNAGKYKNAYSYQKRYQDLNESIVNGENLMKLAQLELDYDLEMKKNEVISLEQKNQLNQAKIKSDKILLISLAAILFLAILLIISNHRRFRLNQKAKYLLEKSNSEKEVLLSEIHHRVKNNLQIVSSLLSIQALQLNDKFAIDVVKENQHRVQAMGLIHESLYQHRDFKVINMQQYFEHLCFILLTSFGYKKNDIDLTVEAENISLDLDTAIPLGLITNELITNSLKHAFPERKSPALRVQMNQLEEGLCLKVEDNGVGGIDFDKDSSFGIELIKELARKLEGTIKIENSKGVKMCLIIKKYSVAA